MKARSLWNSASLAIFSALLLLPLPVRAQKASADDDGASNSKPAATHKAAEPAKPSADAPAKPAKPARDPHIVPGSDYPHWEWFVGYSFLNARFGPGIDSKDANGGSTNIEYNFNHWFGIVADLGGYDFGTITDPTTTPVVITGAHQISYLFGPRLNYRFGDKYQHTVFGQVLIGGIDGNTEFANPGASENAFAMTVGGGVDVGFTKHLAWRVAQVEYMLSNFDYHNSYQPQNDFRFSSGILFRWGAKPIATNRPPTASCSTDVASIMQGSGDTIPVRANASDPDGDTLTYVWSASGGRVDGAGNVVRWSAGDAGPGTYIVTARVDDGHGGNASCSANVRVDPRPAPRPPTLSCSASPSTVMPGERVNVTGNGYSPEGFPLDYSWRANGGQISGSGSQISVDTSGVAPGAYRVTGRVTDSHGASADCVADLRVSAPPPKPQAVKLGECIFKRVGSTRVDNVCSRLLDDAILRLENDPKSTLVLISYEDPVKEKKGNIAQTRGENSGKYLTKPKGGVDSGRVNKRQGQGVEGADTANRRVEIFLVPEGASF